MFKFSFGIFYVIFLCLGCAPRTAYQLQIRKYQQGKLLEDTSAIYQLPYEAGTKHRVIEGYFSRFTHRYRAALDFKMKKGTPVYAIADGMVIRTKDDSNVGGMKNRNKPDGNYVIIEHNDSTRSSYRHLQYQSVIVHPGDSVHSGQMIAKSGMTGYTFTPHLHFMLAQLQDGEWNSIPCRFSTKMFTGYLRPLKKYESLNKLLSH